MHETTNVPTMPAHEIDYFGPDPGMDYYYLPDEPWNPLMETWVHNRWIVLLVAALRNTLAATDTLVVGNVPFLLNDGGPHLAPDVMVIPGAKGCEYDRHHPLQARDMIPSFCLEVRSKSNTRAHLARRHRRLLEIGVAEVYLLDPLKRPETIVRFTLVDGELVEDNAIGMRSDAANISFARVGEEIGICSPGGRVVTFESDPFEWLQDETWRAIQAELQIETVEADRDAALQRLAAAEQAQAAAEAARADAEDAAARRIAELEARLRELEHSLD